jgi:hypothetical protein
MSAMTTSAMCTLHACGDVKVFRTLDECPATASQHFGNTKKKKCLLLFLIFAGGIFF